MRHLYLLTQYFPPVNIVGALRPYRLVKHAANFGYQARVFTLKSTQYKTLDFSLVTELPVDIEITFIDTGESLKIGTFGKDAPVTDHKCIFSTDVKRNGFRRASTFVKYITDKILFPDANIRLVSRFLSAASKSIETQGEAVLFTTSPSHFIQVIGYLLKRKYNLPWVVDLRDPWDYYPRYGNYKIRNPIERKLRDHVIHTADAIISTTNTNTEILRAQFQEVDPAKFHTVSNCYTEELIHGNTEKNKDTFIISYTGIFYDKKDPFTFFRALRTWFDGMDARTRKRYKELLTVQLIGSRSTAVERTIVDNHLQDVVVVIDRVPHKEAVRLTKSSDMVLISTGIGGRTRPGWLPSKLFEYLGCRVPILAITREGDTARIIRETNSGYVVTSEDHEAIHRILETEIQRKFQKRVPDNAPEFTFDGVDEFEEKHVISKMIKIIKNLTDAHL